MGLSKKDQRNREHKAAEKAGTKVQTTAGGVPKKAPKEQIVCTVCKASLIASMPIVLRDHAGKHPKVAPQDCFPGATIAP
ncbi:hypothetical protein MNV49_006067 [Pseudohyphozyma bogoriensis]|nr:hypothetical protein MNV49_006067 [Pseudohyphozyma bogoriensis]